MRSTLGLYYAARLGGQAAQHLFLGALLVIAGTGGHAAAGLSSIFLATTVAALVFGVAGGSLADRIGPARGFAMGAGLRLLVIAFALVLPGGTTGAVIAVFLWSTVMQLYSPAEMALVKVLCSKQAGKAHSLLLALQYTGTALGLLVLAPLCYWLGGPQAMIVGALVAGIPLMVVTGVLAARLADQQFATDEAEHRSLRGVRETISIFIHQAPARDALAVLSVKALVAHAIMVTLPLYVQRDLSMGSEGAVFLLVPGALGAAAGLAFAATSLASAASARTMRLAIGGLTVTVFALAALDYGISSALAYSQVPPLMQFEAALNTGLVLGMPVAFLLGMSLSVATVSGRAAMTAVAPMAIQSRVFAVQALITDALVILPLLLLGVGAELAGARPTLGAIGVVAAATWLVMDHPRFQPKAWRLARPETVASEA